MERLIALFDSDSIFATRFMEYFKRVKDFKFEVTVFTKSECLVEFLNNNNLEILIIDETIDFKDIPRDNIKNLYILTHHLIPNKTTKDKFIYKFQPALAIMKDILTHYEKMEERSQYLDSPDTNVTSIISLCQSVEAQLFAWAYSTLMSEYKKVLFVMLDLLPIQVISTILNDGNALSEFIYYLKENSEVALKLNERMLHINNLSYLSGITHGLDILSLNKDDIQKWTELVRAKADYQLVIFYHSGYTDALTELIKQSDSVIIADRQSYYEEAVYLTWKKQMQKSGITTCQDHFVRTILQEEKGNLPISLEELMHTSAWDNAYQMLHHTN